MVHDSCVLCVCVGVSMYVLLCGVGGVLFDAVWFAVVCDVLCVFVCVVFV